MDTNCLHAGTNKVAGLPAAATASTGFGAGAAAAAEALLTLTWREVVGSPGTTSVRRTRAATRATS